MCASSRGRRERSSRGLVDRPGRGGRVELVRVVEHRRLRRAGGPRVVVRGDRVQQLRARVGRKPRSALLDQAKAEVDMAEQAALLRLPKSRTALELARAADVV